MTYLESSKSVTFEVAFPLGSLSFPPPVETVIISAAVIHESLVKGPDSLWWTTQRFLGFIRRYWKHSGFSSSCLGKALEAVRIVFFLQILSGLLIYLFSCRLFREPQWYFSTCAWQQKNSNAADEFLARPRLWISDHVKSHCGFEIANRPCGDTAN